jgi:hypothetical protein
MIDRAAFDEVAQDEWRGAACKLSRRRSMTLSEPAGSRSVSAAIFIDADGDGAASNLVSAR